MRFKRFGRSRFFKKRYRKLRYGRYRTRRWNKKRFVSGRKRMALAISNASEKKI